MKNFGGISQKKEFTIDSVGGACVVQDIGRFILKSSSCERLSTLRISSARMDRKAALMIGKAVGCLIGHPQGLLSSVEIDYPYSLHKNSSYFFAQLHRCEIPRYHKARRLIITRVYAEATFEFARLRVCVISWVDPTIRFWKAKLESTNRSIFKSRWMLTI